MIKSAIHYSTSKYPLYMHPARHCSCLCPCGNSGGKQWELWRSQRRGCLPLSQGERRAEDSGEARGQRHRCLQVWLCGGRRMSAHPEAQQSAHKQQKDRAFSKRHKANWPEWTITWPWEQRGSAFKAQGLKRKTDNRGEKVSVVGNTLHVCVAYPFKASVEETAASENTRDVREWVHILLLI